MRMTIEIDVPDNAEKAILHHRQKWSHPPAGEAEPLASEWLGGWVSRKVGKWCRNLETDTAKSTEGGEKNPS